MCIGCHCLAQNKNKPCLVRMVVFPHNPDIGIAFCTLRSRQGKKNSVLIALFTKANDSTRTCHCPDDKLQIHMFSFQNIGSLRVNGDDLQLALSSLRRKFNYARV